MTLFKVYRYFTLLLLPKICVYFAYVSNHPNFMRFIITFLICISCASIAFSQDWQFVKKIGGSGDENSSGIAVTSDGSFFVYGRFKGTIILDTITISSTDPQSTFIAKYSGSGNIIWARKAASSITPLLDAVNVNAVATDGSGNVYIAGNYLGHADLFDSTHTSAASSEIFLAKLSGAGDVLWVRTAGGSGVGNYNQNEAYALCTDSSGNCFMTGRYVKNAVFDTITISAELPNEFFIAKYNTDGRAVWVKSGGGDFGIHNGFGVASDKDGNAYVTGDFFGHLQIGDNTIDAVDAEQKIFIAKFSSDGKTLWAKEVGSGGYYGIGSGISVDKSGNAYMAGFFRATINFGATQLTFNRSIIAYAMLAVKYDSEGNFIWAVKTDGDAQNTLSHSICTNPEGFSYIIGNFIDQTSFGSFVLKRDSGVGTFITKLDPQGKFIWAKQTSGRTNDNGSGIALSSNRIMLTGTFSDTIAFDSYLLASSGGSDIFIAELADKKESVDDITKENAEVIFYPNPANRLVHFVKRKDYMLFDFLGRTLAHCPDCNELNVERIPSGGYYLNGHLIIIEHVIEN
jgi:hypothetical protein